LQVFRSRCAGWLNSPCYARVGIQEHAGGGSGPVELGVLDGFSHAVAEVPAWAAGAGVTVRFLGSVRFLHPDT